MSEAVETHAPNVDSATLDVLGRVANALVADPRFAADVITRPHPLLVNVARGELVVLIAPAVVWDAGRELLAPYAARFADGFALVVLLGMPKERDFATALSKGLASVVSADPPLDELYVALQRALELLDT